MRRPRDRYGRLLAYVYVGDTMVNAELVAQGYAQVMTVPPNVKHQDEFLKLQRHDRVYLASRWRNPTNETTATTIAVNFSGDGEDWSGWRVPESTAKPLLAYNSTAQTSLDLRPNAPPGLAAVNNHLYILAPGDQFGDTNQVWAY